MTVSWKRFLPNSRTIWRWHFYAGLFCIPFVIWLAVTGSIYLFKPQIEAWMDKPYEALLKPGEAHVSPEAQVKAALAAVPGSNLHYYELPRTTGGAAQILVGKDADEFRVYVHPASAQVLKSVNEEDRFMRRIFHLHGELLAGDRGSMVVELAGSWTVVLILTGLALWWPREGAGLGGVLYPRLSLAGRSWWRDVHSVTGMWVSLFALTLLLTGLPWAKSWGSYFKKVRSTIAGVTVTQDWPTGSSSEREARIARNGAAAESTDGHRHGEATPPTELKPSRWRRGPAPVPGPDAYLAIDTIFPAALKLPLEYPIQIVPPLAKGGVWMVRSDSQNRMLRDVYTLKPDSAEVLNRETFADRPPIDRIVSLGISVHEGHLFGVVNQVISLFTALGVATLAASSVVMWWRRRPSGALGAPAPLAAPSLSPLLVALIVLLAITFPMLAVSILCVVVSERVVLRRIPSVSLWLGLRQAGY